MAKGERVNVQRTLALVGFFFFIYSAGKTCLFPFLTIYFRQLGLSATQTGILLGLKPFVALLAAPFWVRCAIRHNKRRVILMAAILTLIAANLGLTLLPPVNKDLPLEFCNQEQRNHTDGNSSSYVISPFIDKIGQIVFHADDKEATTTQSSLSASLTGSLSTSSNSSSNHPNDQVPNTVTSRALLPTSPKVDSLSSTGNMKRTEKVPGELEGQKSGINGAQDQPSSGYNSDDNKVNSHIADTSGWNPNGHAHNGNNEEADNLNSDNSGGIDKKTYKQTLELLKEKLKSELDGENSNKAREEMLEDDYQVYRLRRLLEELENSEMNGTENDSLSDEEDISVMTEAREEVIRKEEMLQLEYITFMTALVIVILGEILSSPADKICDDSLYETLDHIDELDKYGRHHVVSLIGMGLAAVAVTVAVHFSDCQIFLDANRIMIHFYAFAGLCGIAFLLTFCYPMQDLGRSVHYEKLFRGLVLLLTDFHNIIVVVTLLLVGFLSASIQNYMFWLIQDLGGSELIMGLTVTVAAVAEMPLLFASGSLTRRLGHIGTLGLAVIAIAARLLYFAYLWTPWAAVPIEILNIFCKGALWESVMLYAEHTAPPGMHRSMQIVMVVLYYGMGSSNGSVISGILYDHVGVKVLYCSFAAVAMFWAVVLIMVAKFVPKRRKLHYSKILRDEEDNNNDDLFDSSDDNEDWLVNALKNDRF